MFFDNIKYFPLNIINIYLCSTNPVKLIIIFRKTLKYSYSRHDARQHKHTRLLSKRFEPITNTRFIKKTKISFYQINKSYEQNI